MSSLLQREVEELLVEREPDVEALLAEVVGGGTLRVFIDHPDGVTLALCERVSALLSPLRERYTLEVSSPGAQRPLTRPEHYRRFVGRHARVRTRGDVSVPPSASQPAARGSARDVGAHQPAPAAARRTGPDGGRQRASGSGRRSYTGELVGASDTEVTLAAEGGLVTIPYAQIRRSNLVEE
jgi:ribosome maturation factor RimP